MLGVEEACKFGLRKVDLFAQNNLLLAFGPRLAQNDIIDWIVAMVSRAAEHLVAVVYNSVAILDGCEAVAFDLSLLGQRITFCLIFFQVQDYHTTQRLMIVGSAFLCLPTDEKDLIGAPW